MAKAQSKADVGDRFSRQLDALVETGKSTAKSLRGEDRRLHTDVDKGDWDGDLTDLSGISSAFSREEHSEDVVEAIKNVDEPGVIGDLIASAMQGDYLAMQERAFRSRHTSVVRRRLQAAARRAGHGDDRGLFKRGVLGYVESVLKQSKG